jgi:hypothetical protein
MTRIAIPTGMNLQGESLENWSSITLQKVATTLGLDKEEDPRLSQLVRFAIGKMQALPPTSPANTRSVLLCANRNLPADYAADWSWNTLQDVACVLGLPQGATLADLPACATKVVAEIGALSKP